MNELDFDELHEAVNKLMGQAQKPKGQGRPSAKPIAPTTSRPPLKVTERPTQRSVKPVVEKKENKEKKEEKPKTSEKTNIVVRRTTPAATGIKPKKRGMAMDVIQTQKPAVVPPPSMRAPRVAKTVRPNNSPVTPAPSPHAVVPTPHTKEEKPKITPEVSEDVLKSIDMQSDIPKQPLPHAMSFDSQPPSNTILTKPLDTITSANENTTQPKEPSPHKNIPDVLDALRDDTNINTDAAVATQLPPVYSEGSPKKIRRNDWEMPRATANETTMQREPEAEKTEPPSMAPAIEATPFVNANVQKRPLGAYAVTQQAAPPPSPRVVSEAVPSDTIPVAADEPKATESKTQGAENIETPIPPEELSPELVAVESAEPEFTPNPASHEAAPIQNLRNMSIPRQYHASEKEPSKDDRPVFDTKDYHTPLQTVAVPHHQHSGNSKAGILLTIILIILLVVAATVAYFVVTGGVSMGALL